MRAKRKAIRPYSVLLSYPEAESDGPETWYGFVRAASAPEAVERARLRAAGALRRGDDIDGDDLRALAGEFPVELVLPGHRRGLPWE